MRILILGGSGLTGPHQARYALQRGHDVTLFNRGRAPLAADLQGARRLQGDRATGDLDALRSGEWDVVIDVHASLPSWVRDTTRVLSTRVTHYVFISTISVYEDLSQPVGEDAASARYLGANPHDETLETMRASGFELYGPLKAVCERVVQQAFSGACTIVRPGLIVGPGDASDRFTYWPLRVRRGGEVLAPGEPQDPVQFIDARDLAEWVVRLAEKRVAGVFNATGPAQATGLGTVLETMREATRSDARFTWVPAGFLAAQGVQPWSDMPAWVPAGGEMAGMMRADIRRALAAGLTFRPLAQTVRDTLGWFDTLPAERREAPRAGIPPAREREVLAQWHARQAAPGRA